MSDEFIQTTAFPEIVPEAAQSPAAPREDVLVPRPPGWRLVANSGGPKGFHRVKTVGTEGSVRTLCGIVGHPITDSERMIVLCPACEAVTPA